jgi:hypothetical protein
MVNAYTKKYKFKFKLYSKQGESPHLRKSDIHRSFIIFNDIFLSQIILASY